jgi:hypothetical protein
MPVTKDILEDCRRRFSAGQTDEILIAHLRQLGLSKVETIKVFVDLNRASPLEAKRLIHLSPAWKDAYQRDEKLHDTLEQLARAEADNKSTDGQ